MIAPVQQELRELVFEEFVNAGAHDPERAADEVFSLCRLGKRWGAEVEDSMLKNDFTAFITMTLHAFIEMRRDLNKYDPLLTQ